ELEQKQLKHVRNFTPTHYSWQQSLGSVEGRREMLIIEVLTPELLGSLGEHPLFFLHLPHPTLR
ncbi:12363_t:CDS:1, partial [Ambispora gerdemannii]